MKKLIKRGLVAVLIVALSIPLHIQIFAVPQVFYSILESTRLSRNTYLHEAVRLTEAGLVGFSVLGIPLNDPFLDVGVFNSQQEFGLKQSVTTLLDDHGAFAGVNGDFFGLAGRHSVSLGLEVVDGEISVHNGLNYSGNTSASLIFGDGTPFIDYIRPQIGLILGGERTFNVGQVNMVSDLAFPSFLTYGTLQSTDSIDRRLGRSYKLVVQNGIITNITYFTVDIPQNGFVIIMNPQTFATNEHRFYVGQSAEMEINANVDLEAINTAISGSNRILHHGQIPDIAATRATARHPRTLLGLNATACRLILMSIDGRGDSIGASLAEAAAMMRDFGAYHAINLDGGGSTTMAAARPGAGLGLINSPSEGRQRNVINAIGVKNSSPIGNIASLEFIGTRRYVPVGLVENFEILAFDEYKNPMNIPLGLLEFEIDNCTLVYSGFIALSPGSVTIRARLGDIVAEARFHAVYINEIIPSVGFIYGQTWLSFRGVDNYGRGMALSPQSLNFQVEPPYLGEMDGGWFVPQTPANGWLGVAAHNARIFLPVVMHPHEYGIFELPESTTASDSLRIHNMEAPEEDDIDLLFYGSSWGYASYYLYGSLVIHLNAREGGIMATNPIQWRFLAADLAATQAETIVIHTNFPPMYFGNRTEFQLFHRLVRDLADAGRNIFVVSTGGQNSWTFLWDGVRYINLEYEYEYEQLVHLAILRLRFNVYGMYYSVERVLMDGS